MRPEKISPQPGQESVWDYPRPPRMERCTKTLRVVADEIIVAETDVSYRVLETSHPPVYYLPPEHVRMDLLSDIQPGSFCEWKGMASYYALNLPGRRIEQAAWTYTHPSGQFVDMAGYIAFYADKLSACYVDDELVVPQPGGFYGGWITKDVVGPFKGMPGTSGW